MHRIHILVEGQTEERFVKDVLGPHLLSIGIAPYAKIIVTKRTKTGCQFKGGISSFGKITEDLHRLLKDTSVKKVTTLFDFYGFPRDFPAWDRVKGLYPEDKVIQLERLFEDCINDSRFKAYIMLHEFESMLFANPEVIAQTLNNHSNSIKLRRIQEEASGPEKIDDGVDTHPSARLSTIFPQYQKVLHGPLIINRIGLEKVRSMCPHFNSWLSLLENLT